MNCRAQQFLNIHGCRRIPYKSRIVIVSIHNDLIWAVVVNYDVLKSNWETVTCTFTLDTVAGKYSSECR